MSGEGIPLIPISTVGPLLVTKRGLAEALSVSERTIDNWREHGIIPCLEFGPRFVRFNITEVQAALAQRYRLQAKGKVKTKLATYKKGEE